MTTTSVTFLLDRSGSMRSILDATLEGFNAYLAELKQNSETLFTLFLFDSEGFDTVMLRKPIAEVEPLTAKTFVPRGSTPLIDSCHRTICEVEAKTVSGEKTVVCFQTDGEENHSREHNWRELSVLVEKKQGQGWQFNFMGAGINAYAQARQMGLGAGQTMSYDSKNLSATRSAFRATGAATQSFAGGQSINTEYADEDKVAAGDKFADDAAV